MKEIAFIKANTDSEARVMPATGLPTAMETRIGIPPQWEKVVPEDARSVEADRFDEITEVLI